MIDRNSAWGRLLRYSETEAKWGHDPDVAVVRIEVPQEPGACEVTIGGVSVTDDVLRIVRARDRLVAIVPDTAVADIGPAGAGGVVTFRWHLIAAQIDPERGAHESDASKRLRASALAMLSTPTTSDGAASPGAVVKGVAAPLMQANGNPAVAPRTAEARRFLTELRAGGGTGPILLSARVDRTFPTFPLDSVEAVVDRLDADDGPTDVFVRVTGAPAPASGRGTAAETQWVPGVWVDLDVGDGGFPDTETAIRAVNEVVPTTMLVASGSGVHGYVLFHEVFPTFTEADRARAHHLVLRFQAEVREHAKAYGVRKVDSTADLARVLRLPGTLNGKNPDAPAPCTLLSAGGPRYTYEQLDDLLPALPEAAAAPVTATDHGGGTADVAEVLAATPKLTRIINRQGRAPGKGSASEWDFYLACEAWRCGYGEPIMAALIRHARAINGDPKRKGPRADYVDRTVREAVARVNDTGQGDRPASEHEELSRGYGLTGRAVTGGVRRGGGEAAIVTLELSDGSTARLGRLGDLFTGPGHTKAAAVAFGTVFDPFSAKDAAHLAQLVIRVTAAEGDLPQTVVTEGWVDDYVAGAPVIVGTLVATDAATSWPTASDILRTEEDAHERRGSAARAAVVRTEEERLWVPVGALRASIAPGAPKWGDLDALMLEAGWERVDLDFHEPGKARSEAGRFKRSYYVSAPER